MNEPTVLPEHDGEAILASEGNPIPGRTAESFLIALHKDLDHPALKSAVEVALVDLHDTMSAFYSLLEHLEDNGIELDFFHRPPVQYHS